MTDSWMRPFSAFVVFLFVFFSYILTGFPLPPLPPAPPFPLLVLHPLLFRGFSSEKCGLPMEIKCWELPF